MKQAFIKKGNVITEETPAPVVSDGCVLIQVVYSCISAGTETSNVQASGKSLIRKALDQPEQIKKIWDLTRSDGISAVLDKIKNKMNSTEPTGYSLAGIVLAAGRHVTSFETGDAVAAAGTGYAHHAEFVEVPVNLVVRIPQDMDMKKASTVALGSIALQGVRRANLNLGEFAVIIGAGILGLITLQILRTAGVRCAITDPDDRRLAIAGKLGAEMTLNPLREELLKSVDTWTQGKGADAVIFTAATQSDEPLSQAFQMCRKKGRVVLVGVSGMNIRREDLFPKELDFLISTSYGPGRYDPHYEEKGLDYPYGYVRWTEKRNMEEYIRLLYIGAIQLDPMMDLTFPIDQASEAFQSLKDRQPKPLLVFLHYNSSLVSPNNQPATSIYFRTNPSLQQHQKKILQIALVGVGSFVTGMHLPNLNKLSHKYQIRAIMDRNGHRSRQIAEQQKAAFATTSFDDILQDPDIDLVFIATRHDSHAALTLKALEAGKHVFVEKPLAVNQEELNKIINFYQLNPTDSKPLLMVGYNRRFSPYAGEIKKVLHNRMNPVFIHYRMNAGYLPADHWVHEHGGRIIGEACHIIDLVSYLVGKPVIRFASECLSPVQSKYQSTDNKTITLKFEDGSLAVLDYFSVGSRNFPKEYMEIHFEEKTIILNDYRSLDGYGVPIQSLQTKQNEKGHLEELIALYEALTLPNRGWPISLQDLIQTSQISFYV